MSSPTNSSHVVDLHRLPADYPTHLHDAIFWEWLGRVVATFGFLEEMLQKAIFSFTATRRFSTDEIEAAYQKWEKTLRRAISDPLGELIAAYETSVREHPEAAIANLPDLLTELRSAAALRNVLCHGSWRKPDANGASLPHFVNRGLKVFDTKVDVAFLQETQRHVAELACAVVSTVTCMGWQFPGSHGPGSPVWPDQPKSLIPNP